MKLYKEKQKSENREKKKKDKLLLFEGWHALNRRQQTPINEFQNIYLCFYFSLTLPSLFTYTSLPTN